MRNDRDPLQQKAKRLGAKNMELVQTNRRQEDRITNQQDEILSLVIISFPLFFCLRNLYPVLFWESTSFLENCARSVWLTVEELCN